MPAGEVAAGFRPMQLLVSGMGVLAAAVLVALLVQGGVEDRREDIAVLGAGFAYMYVVADNRITQHLAGVLGATDAGGYGYLVYPTYRSGRTGGDVDQVDFRTAHEALVRNSPPFDFSCPAAFRKGESGYEGPGS